VFLSREWPYGRLKAGSVYNAASRIYDAAGVRCGGGERRGTHLLRRTAASSMMAAGISREVIASTLGHASRESTETYLVADVEALQLQFSMVDLDNVEVLKWAHDQDLGVMTYGSLDGGILTGRYRTLAKYEMMDNRNRFYPYFREPMFSKVMKLLEVMQPIADERGVQLAEIAMNWSRQKPFVDTSIFGAQTRARIESNVRCLDWELTSDEMRVLDEAIAEII
jgi:aryl-alcohol dehydrogenase-like predicted oxidoreductase